MATFNSDTLQNGRNTVYRTECQEGTETVEFSVTIGSGVTLTDGDFINLFDLGEGHRIVKMKFQSSDELDTDGTPALVVACGWAQFNAEDTNYGPAIVFANTTTEFEQDPVDTVIEGLYGALTGDHVRRVRLEVITSAAAATDSAAVLKGYAVIKRTEEALPSLTYGWDGEEA